MPRLVVSRRTGYRLLLAIGLPAVFVLTLWLVPGKTASTNTATAGVRDNRLLFTAVVDGVRAGRSYYEVYGTESRRRGYPTRSVFNWRQPLLMRLLASVPPRVGLLTLIALAAALLVQAHGLLRRQPLGALTVINAALVVIVPGVMYFTEPWAGLCLGLSAVAYGRQRETTGATWALLALFIRELAAPYCVIAVILALSRKRWREVGVWIGGGGLYALYYGAHVWQVWQHALPGDAAHSHSWLYGGGLPFVIRIWQQNGILALLPAVVFSLVVVAAVAAWWAPQMPMHVRASVLVYSVLFLFIGLPFNANWGGTIAPLVALWLAYAPNGLSTLWTFAQLPRTAPRPMLRGMENLSMRA
jgi:hypothetical protein